jgi:gliding motility-associated-like protein
MKALASIIALLFCLQAQSSFALLPTDKAGIKFIENKGQFLTSTGKLASDVLFYAEAGNIRYMIRKTGISYVVLKNEMNVVKQEGIEKPVPQKRAGVRMDMNWMATESNIQAAGQLPYPHKLNYYNPQFPNGLLGVLSYKKVVLKNIYKNIDVVFYTKGDQLKYDYVIHKGGDYKKIKFSFEGTDGVEFSKDTLSLKYSFGVLKDFIPESHLMLNGQQKDLAMHFKQEQNNLFTIQTNEVVGNFETMVIDPAIWITYYGGTELDYSLDIECDVAGNIYMTGYTGSLDFPITPGAFQAVSLSIPATGQSNYISKFNSAGNLLWSTYYSGSYFEEAHGVCVDDANNAVYMCGNTYSSDFPVTVGCYQPALSGASADAFVVKFDENGVRLWATYMGGTGFEMANKIEKDNSGNVWITGGTASSGFPTLAAYDATYNGGGNDVFLAKFSPAGALLYSTFLGGSVEEIGIDIDFTPGFIGITGNTRSANFPCTADAFDAALGGALADGFYAKFTLAGVLVYSTMMGGGDLDLPQSINYDNLGCAVIGGHVKSVDFPTTPGALQTVYGGSTQDCFLMRFNVDNSINWSTYYGNNHWEYNAGVTIDEDNNIYLNSYWRADASFADLPVLDCGFQKTFAGVEDNFIVKFDQNCTPVCTTYLGGNLIDANDIPGACIEYANKFLHIALYTEGNFPVTPGAYQTTFMGYYDIALAKLCSMACGDTLSNASFDVNDTICVDIPTLFSARGVSCDNSEIFYQWSFPGGVPSSSTAQSQAVTYNTAGTYTATLTVRTPCDTTVKTMSFSVGSLGLLTLNITPSANPVCVGDPITISSVVGGGVGPFEYQWSTASTDTLASLTFSPTATGYVSLYVENDVNCPVFDSVLITAIVVPNLVASANTCVCEGESVTLTATGAPSYVWSTGATTASISVSPDTLTSYYVTYTSGPCMAGDTVVVCVNPSPVVFASNDTIIDLSTSSSVDIELFAVGDGPFYWSPSTGLSCDTCPDPIATVTYPITYTVTVTNAFGCSATDSVVIDFVLIIPNIITPNGDGINDKFTVVGLPPESAISIYNRWGNLLYDSANYANDWSIKSEGVYYYVIITPDGEPHTGFVHVNL